MVGKVTAGLVESNGSPPPGGWLIVACGLTACTPGSAQGPTFGNEYGKPLPLLKAEWFHLYFMCYWYSWHIDWCLPFRWFSKIYCYVLSFLYYLWCAFDNSCIGCAFQTSKRKFFVLRKETSSGPARVEYYDSEKKFQSSRLARRCILLKNCFSINAKSDSTRHRHMIVLYTEDDCFGIACGSEAEQQDWLNTMVQLRCESLNSSSRSTTAYSK